MVTLVIYIQIKQQLKRTEILLKDIVELIWKILFGTLEIVSCTFSDILLLRKRFIVSFPFYFYDLTKLMNDLILRYPTILVDVW